MTDNAGLVFAYALDGSGGGHALDADSFASAGLNWIHLDYSAPETRSMLQELDLEPYVVETLTRFESRPHTIAVDDGLMVILRGINRNAGADPEDMVSIRIWVEQSRIVTVRQRPIKAAQLTRGQIEEGVGPASTWDVLISIITHLADGVAIFVDNIEERMEACEEAVDEQSTGEIRSEISAIRRQVASVRRYLAPQREALETLNRFGNKVLQAEQVFALREQSDRITRYVEDLDLVREHALVAQEDLMNRVAQEQNARTYLFSVVATIFLPITFITGMFGMNTAGLPGLEEGRAFWYVAAGMLVVAVAVTIWLRMKKWF